MVVWRTAVVGDLPLELLKSRHQYTAKMVLGAVHAYSAMTKLKIHCNPLDVVSMRRHSLHKHSNSQIALLNIDHGFPRVEAFFDKYIVVLIKTQATKDYSKVGHPNALTGA